MTAVTASMLAVCTAAWPRGVERQPGETTRNVLVHLGPVTNERQAT